MNSASDRAHCLYRDGKYCLGNHRPNSRDMPAVKNCAKEITWFEAANETHSKKPVREAATSVVSVANFLLDHQPFLLRTMQGVVKKQNKMTQTSVFSSNS